MNPPSPQAAVAARSIHKQAKLIGIALASAEWLTVLVVLNLGKLSHALSFPRSSRKAWTAWRNSKPCKPASELIRTSMQMVGAIPEIIVSLPNQF